MSRGHNMHVIMPDAEYAILRDLAEEHYAGSITATVRASLRLMNLVRQHGEFTVTKDDGTTKTIVLI